MKICILSYEYDPFPGGGIATYNNAAARVLAEAGHEVHVVTNGARHGKTDERYGLQEWSDGNLTVHRLDYFDDRREPARNVQFLDVCPDRYGPREQMWASEPSNIAAVRAAAYVEHLHLEVGLDVIESPEFFAEAYYILRARNSGRSGRFPPVCTHGHISSRFAFGANQHIWEIGYYRHRQMMLREEYCVQEGDALLTPSHALMHRYQELFGDRLPAIRRTIPYFLELPASGGELPAALRDGVPFLVCVGRVEPRKGSDLAMRAFAELGERFDGLRLVFLGKEMWHQGESVDDLVALHVPAPLRDRVLRLGNVPREQALAAARQAAAFLHPAPWDNYPCAVLEAMGVGACCVVSDQGGHAEMVEHQQSGLVFPAGDAGALAASVERVLTDTEFALRAREAAIRRAQEITEPHHLVDAKIEMFEAMIEQERATREPHSGAVLRAPLATLPPLPGRGVVLLDAAGVDQSVASASLDSIMEELESSPDWQLTAIVDPGQDIELGEQTRPVTTIEDPVWLEMAPDDVFVYVLAGTRFDAGRLREMVCQVRDSRVRCGSFVWLRPPDASVFPYSPDFGWQDMLIGGQPLPATFAVQARHLEHCRSLAGLYRPKFRLVALMAAAAAQGEMSFQHTGDVSGDYYLEVPLVDRETQFRVLGFLDLLGGLPRAVTQLGHLTQTQAWAAPPQPAAEPPRERVTVREVVREVVRTPDDYQMLQMIYAEHTALKQHPVVRLLRRLGLFSVVRRLFPKSRQLIGPGR